MIWLVCVISLSMRWRYVKLNVSVLKLLYVRLWKKLMCFELVLVRLVCCVRISVLSICVICLFWILCIYVLKSKLCCVICCWMNLMWIICWKLMICFFIVVLVLVMMCLRSCVVVSGLCKIRLICMVCVVKKFGRYWLFFCVVLYSVVFVVCVWFMVKVLVCLIKCLFLRVKCVCGWCRRKKWLFLLSCVI